MHSTKYIIVQEESGWRGYLEGYPELEAYGDSFEELQVKLWQLHQELSSQTQGCEQDQYQAGEHDRHHSLTPTMSRPMSAAYIKRRARVEQVLFAVISNR